MDKNDQRVHERFATQLSAEIKQLAFRINTQAQCRDISAGGAGVIAGEKITPNTRIEILLEAGTPVRSFGRVVWTEKVQEKRWRMGLQFDQADAMRIQRIFGRR